MSFSKRVLNQLDAGAAAAHLKLAGEHPGLSVFLFHSIFRDAAEVSRGHVYPQERVTVALFRRFVDYFLAAGYEFIAPDAIPDKTQLSTQKKYALITLDDGYYNNIQLTTVLAEYNIPALFFIATRYVAEGIRFWSDAVYYERKRRGAGEERILQEIMMLKNRRVKEIFSYLRNNFGRHALEPVSDIDRPLTPGELAAFSLHPLVHLGNHTHSHELLTALTPPEMRLEMQACSATLKSITGAAGGGWISYPNGSYNDAVLKVAAEEGFKAGITTVQQKNNLPLAESALLQLSRFNPVADPQGRLPLEKFRSSLQLKTLLKAWLQ